MAGLTRRDAVASLAAVSMVPGEALAAVPAWSAWKDVLNLLTTPQAMNAERQRRNRPSVGMTVQRIEDAKGEHVNFDLYAVEVSRPPTGALSDPKALFQYMRINLNSFFDHAIASVAGYQQADVDDWKKPGPAPLGSVMQFGIEVFGPVHEEAAVVTSASNDLSFVFSPVTIGTFSPGEHPVSGNRMFRLEPMTTGYRLVTRAADRAIDSPSDITAPSESTVFSGGDRLWRSWQKAVAKLITDNGGAATIKAPIIIEPRPTWTEVKASGVFTRP